MDPPIIPVGVWTLSLESYGAGFSIVSSKDLEPYGVDQVGLSEGFPLNPPEMDETHSVFQRQ